MGIIALSLSDVPYISIAIEVEVALCRFEEDFSFFRTPFLEDFIEIGEMPEDVSRWI